MLHVLSARTIELSLNAVLLAAQLCQPGRSSSSAMCWLPGLAASAGTGAYFSVSSRKPAQPAGALKPCSPITLQVGGNNKQAS